MEYLRKQKETLFKGKPVQLFDLSGNLVSEYISILEMSKIFKCCRKTIRKYLNTPEKIYRKCYYIRYKQTTNYDKKI